MYTILLIILVLVLIGVLPTWPLQHGLGILPQWWSRLGPHHCACVGFDGPWLARGDSSRLNHECRFKQRSG